MKKKSTVNITISDLMPLVIFLLMVVIFGILTGGQIFTGSNLKHLFNQTLGTLICVLGMVFVAAMGGTDITVGSLTALGPTLAFVACGQIGEWAFIPIVLAIGILSGVIMGVINGIFKVSSFMGSLALLIAYRAVVNLVLKSNAFTWYKSLSFFSNFGFELISVLILIAVIVFVFHYTPFGMYVRGIGENEVAMEHAGVQVAKIKIWAFVVCGLMTAIASLFLTARVGGTNNTMGSGFEMKVMMAMFIGGIPVQGGMGSKIHKLVIGAPTIMLLENGLVLCGVDGTVTQLVRGIVLIGAIYLTGVVNEKFRYGMRMNRKLAV